MAALTDWCFIKGNHFHLRGIVTGHPKLADGMDITTSYVETVVRQNDSLVAKTKSGTVYNLGLAEIGMDKEVVYDTIVLFVNLSEPESCFFLQIK